MLPLPKELLGYISIAFAIVSYVPYIHGILKGRFKPHVFSWFIWTVITLVTFAAQWVKGGGAGSWTTAFTCVMCFVLTILGFTHGEKNITRSDWIILFCALLSIPLWYATNDPVWSVVLLTMIDVVAYYPMFRKSWHKPFEESVFSAVITAVKLLVSLLALEQVNVTTALFPATLAVVCSVLTVMLLWRRRAVKAG